MGCNARKTNKLFNQMLAFSPKQFDVFATENFPTSNRFVE
jgi:hypothetical protein